MSDTPTSTPTPRPKSSNDWLGAILGLALIAYGAYLLITSQGSSYLGLFYLLLGVAFQPWAIVSIIGGVGLLIWAGWWIFFKALGPMDYIFALVAIIVGLGAILERGRGFLRK